MKQQTQNDMITFELKHPNKLAKIGIITATHCNSDAYNSMLELRLSDLIEKRKTQELTQDEEHIRSEARNMLRYQKYKPTGRSKPASEYLVRTVQEGQFPRINLPVDINNYISLKYLLPISLWDLEKAGVSLVQFRPGFEGEEYVFNSAGQIISVTDLLSGFGIMENGETFPMVNPVKDSLKTKTDASTQQIGVAIYYPSALKDSILAEAMQEFRELLESSGAVIHDFLVLD